MKKEQNSFNVVASRQQRNQERHFLFFFAKFPQNWLLGICRVRFGSCVTKQKLYQEVNQK